MTDKIKNHLVEYAIYNGWQTDNDTLFEIIREGTEVYTEKICTHRWYDDIFIVTEVNGMHIGYNGFYMTGDNNASDMGLEYDLKSICEVKEVEKTIKVFEKI